MVDRRVRIADVYPAGRPGRPTTAAAWIVPGFVDIHVHGGGGHTFTTGDPAQARAAAAFHAGHGTTTMLASLVTAPQEAARARPRRRSRRWSHEGVLAGVHYEGPYLSAARCGAQNPAHLRDPDLAELDRPARPGRRADGDHRTRTARRARAPSASCATHGVVAAIGHTDATYEQTLAAVEAGATVATHVCNAMRPVHHRDPGPIVALLDSPGVVCEQVADGVHLHDGMLGHVVRAAGPHRVALVTDAMAAAGMADGEYDLGGQAVTVADGVARLTGNGTIAGSTLTMDAALRRAVHSGCEHRRRGRDGVDHAGPSARASATTAGAIAAGLRADLVLLDEELRVIDVLRAGEPYPS